MARGPTILGALAEAMLQRQRWDSWAALAAAAGTTPATADRWFTYLVFHRVVTERSGVLEVDLDRLFRVLTATRVANLRPERPLPLEQDAEVVHRMLRERRIPHAFAMFTAANMWAFYEPHRDVHLYVERSGVPRVHTILGPTRRRAGDAASPARLFLYTENLDALTIQTRGGLPVTSPLQTTLDLRAHPEGGAHADFLQRHVLPRLRGPPN